MKDFENSLDTMLEKAFLTISNGVDDSKSYFHTPTVCTFEGQDISARTVVLRDFNDQKRVLRFHTDQRSPKISQIKENNTATVHAYDQEEKIQIRLKGSIEVHHQDSVTKKAWENTREMSKDSPIKRIDYPDEFDIDKNQIDREMGYENFAVNLFTFQCLEILYLKRAGHRRAIFEWHNNEIKKNWLIP
jgi:pyridoxamine 5'-phosphate oxidase